jgi:outer membrane receptor protein involved in Fe transport
MIKLRNLILLLLCLQLSKANAQVLVKGIVTENLTGEGVPLIIVSFGSDKNTTTTDAGGKFSIALQPGNYNVIVKGLGYSDFKSTVNISADTNLFFRLTASTIDKEAVVISATRAEQNITDVPVSIELLKPRYIEHSNQTTMETAIEQVPGVTVIDGQANIRGGSGFSYGAGTRVLVLIDDLPVLAGDANDVKWSFMPIETVEQVEVLKGASSALYGSSALNGVINMRTKYAKDVPQTTITTYGGVYDTPSNETMKWWSGNRGTAGVNFFHARKIKNLDLVAGGQYFNDAGYRQGETEERIRGNFNLRYNFKKLTGLTAGLAVNAQRAEGGNFLLWENDTSGALIPSGGTGENSTLSSYTTTRISVDPSISYSKGKASHKLRSRYFMTENVNDTEQGSKASTTYTEYLFRYSFSEAINLTAGATATFNNVDGDLYGKQKSETYGGYLQLDGQKGIFTWSAGYRVEKASISDTDLDAEQLFRAGINAHILNATWLRTSFGQGFRFPAIAEKYIRTSVGSIVIYPNDSLQTERGFSFEVGARQGFKIGEWKGLLDAAYFLTEYEDMMEFTFGAYGNPFLDPLFGLGFKSKNIGNTRITGVEIGLTGDGQIGKFRETISTGVTLIDPISLDFNTAVDTLTNTSTENVLKYRYRTMFKLDTETGYQKFYIGFSARYYSFMENIDKIFEVAIPGVKNFRATHDDGDWIFDARLGFEMNEKITLSAIVKNLTNHEWATRPADMQPPRSFVMQLVVKL